MRSGSNGAAQTQPGVVWVNGVDHDEESNNSMSHGPDQQYDISENGASALEDEAEPPNFPMSISGFTLVEAETVVEEDSIGNNSRPTIVFDAKPITWWRRNQLLLSVALVILTIGITLLVVFASKNSTISDDPTTSPTTMKDGIEKSAFDLVISRSPQAEGKLLDQSTPQYEALRWVTEKAQFDPSFYTDYRLLQQYSLVTFFLSTGSISSWENHGGWLEASDECEWHGVECGAKGSGFENMVTRIQLTSNGISGSLPNDLAILSSSLSSLVLEDNSLSGAIPDDIGQLMLLTDLNLSGNQLIGNLPEVIGELESLVLLDLSQNTFISTIPTEIGMLSVLRSMKLGNNQLFGSIPPEIGLLHHLEEVDFQKNNLSYAIPAEISQLSSLKKLHLQENKLLGPLPPEMSSLSELQIMDISRNFVFGEIPKEYWQLGSLPNLEHFDVSRNLLLGTLPNNFARSWKRLKVLRLGGRNFLRGTIPKSLFSLGLLEVLDMSSNFFIGTISESVAKLSNIQILDLSNNYLSGELPQAFSNLKKLQVLDLSGNRIEGGLP
eukprot:CAMPEP_0194241774 /NCGR_PEP_ID=MMETSP0158-20130606/7527_1 /TAXON_ID=33649 /ORGANISM="Thalassionema nitzschioides, Strain L26-B" /LENGTH=551 /DNA_ID=CAMNT_0038976727 /DNA_START=62 /DNA_END=1713 /DNA_ORIENTATION=-